MTIVHEKMRGVLVVRFEGNITGTVLPKINPILNPLIEEEKNSGRKGVAFDLSNRLIGTARGVCRTDTRDPWGRCRASIGRRRGHSP